MRVVVASFVNGTKACGLLVEGGKKIVLKKRYEGFHRSRLFRSNYSNAGSKAYVQ